MLIDHELTESEIEYLALKPSNYIDIYEEITKVEQKRIFLGDWSKESTNGFVDIHKRFKGTKFFRTKLIIIGGNLRFTNSCDLSATLLVMGVKNVRANM